ncbi:hypothetical protein [Arthrobacter agilis]|uniref:hypothetical protein n=1 Tax=Arthrobacter agilis TaxID=37921 RepID=UPI0027804A45|nr:hypothetical protein [Arthrobacter agilis]MDQ0734706.1 hypothetical protein [Arthrobacter agilis]
MSIRLRFIPGMTALILSLLSGYLWTQEDRLLSFTTAHMSSALLCLGTPIAFVLVGRALGCRPDLIKLGAVLLAIASVPMLIANGIYLVSFRSADGAAADIGGFGIGLLGWAALLVTSLACTISLPLAMPTNPEDSTKTHLPTQR